MGNFLRRLDRALARSEEFFLATALGFMALVVFCDFALRETVNESWVWAKELAAFLMVWVGFVGASLAAHRGRHLVLRAGERIFSARLRKWTSPVSSLLTAALCFHLAWLGIAYVTETQAMGERSLTLGIPLWMVQAVIPFAFTTVGLRFLGAGLGILEALPTSDPEGTHNPPTGLKETG